MSKPTVLLTGATGFLGSHLLEALIQQGYQVVVLKRSTSNLWRIEHLAVQYRCYDVDLVSLEIVFVNNKVDVIVHLATLYKKFEEPSDIAGMIDANVSFPSQLIAEGVKHGIKAFINTGTFFEYDCRYQPVNEQALPKAFNFYAKTKLAFEVILKTYSDQICINTFKLFSPFGERDNPKLVPLIIKSGLSDEALNLSEGLQKIDLIYVKDVVNAYVKSIERMENQSFKSELEVFNLGSGEPLSIRDIVSIVEESLGKRLEVCWGCPAEYDIPVAYADIGKAKRLLNWEPIHGVKSGVKNTIEYLKLKKGESST